MRIGTAIEGVGLISSFLRQPSFFLRSRLHGTSTSRAINMASEQVVFFTQWQVAFIRFIGLELFLRPFIDDRVDKSGYAARYFSPVLMHLSLALAIRPDLLPLFAHDEDADVLQVHQEFSHRGVPPEAMLNFYFRIIRRLLLKLPCIGRRQHPVFREFVRYCPQAHIQL